MKNISAVVKAGLCAQCGTCYSACPNNAISFVTDGEPHFRPHVSDGCNNCGICLKVCPGHELDYCQLNQNVFGEVNKNQLVGIYKNIFIGESADNQIRAASSSGGIVASLLCYCIDKKIIDGAIILSARENEPLKPSPFIGTNREDIYRAQKTIYFPVPINTCLKGLNNNDSYALVGLPCQIDGFRKYIKTNPNLPGKVVLAIGLFCGYSPSVDATKFLLEYLGITLSKVAFVKYRDGEWPGRFTIVMKNGKTIINKSQMVFQYLSQIFMNRRCALCVNQTNELADISVGDAWNIQSKDGHSIFISRTDIGDKIVYEAQKNQYIAISPVKEDDLIKSQYKMLYYKKYGYWYRTLLLRFVGQKTPNIVPVIKHKSIHQIIANIILLISQNIVKSKGIKKILLCDKIGPRLLNNYRYYLGELLAR